MTDGPGGFLSRWSRRKRRGKPRLRGGAAPLLSEQRVPTEETDRAVAGTPATEQDLAPGATAALATLPANSEGAAPGPPELPSIESLSEDSDYSVFMNEGVPEDLRRLALRKLWRLTPGVRDGLDDYDDDYTIAEWVREAIPGADQVGRELSDPDDEAAAAETAAVETTDDRAPAPTEEAVAEAEETTDTGRESVADAADSEDPRGEPGKA